MKHAIDAFILDQLVSPGGVEFIGCNVVEDVGISPHSRILVGSAFACKIVYTVVPDGPFRRDDSNVPSVLANEDVDERLTCPRRKLHPWEGFISVYLEFVGQTDLPQSF